MSSGWGGGLEIWVVFIGPGGEGFEPFLPRGGEFAHHKNFQGFCPGGMVRLGTD